MIEELLDSMTPYIINGRRLYDQEDIKKAASILIRKMQSSPCVIFEELRKQNTIKSTVIEQYPEATC